LLLLPERDAAGAGNEHLLLVAERRRRGGRDRGGGLGVGQGHLEAEESAFRPRRRRVIGLLGGRRLRGSVGALSLLRHGSVLRGLEGGEKLKKAGEEERQPLCLREARTLRRARV
jgi:hypothetical protein